MPACVIHSNGEKLVEVHRRGGICLCLLTSNLSTMILPKIYIKEEIPKVMIISLFLPK